MKQISYVAYWAIDVGILYDILSKERNEFEMNILTEFDDEEFAKVMHDDGYDGGYIAGKADGIEKGIEKEKENIIVNT